MRRQRLGEPSDRHKVKALLKGNNPGWKQTRLMALKMSFSSANTIGLIAQRTGVNPRTIDCWLATYRQRGLDALLSRGTEGNHRPRTVDDEVLDYPERGLHAERWNTLVEATAELEQRFERRFDYKTVWTWAKKCAGVLRDGPVR